MSKYYSVYIVQCKDKTLYTGIAKDVNARIKTHNAGRGAKYTRVHGPVKLVYCEGTYTCGNALRREREIKKMPRTLKLLLVKNKIALKRKPKRKKVHLT